MYWHIAAAELDEVAPSSDAEWSAWMAARGQTPWLVKQQVLPGVMRLFHFSRYEPPVAQRLPSDCPWSDEVPVFPVEQHGSIIKLGVAREAHFSQFTCTKHWLAVAAEQNR